MPTSLPSTVWSQLVLHNMQHKTLGWLRLYGMRPKSLSLAPLMIVHSVQSSSENYNTLLHGPQHSCFVHALWQSLRAAVQAQHKC